ncbi:MAG: RtcB family protein [Verrucomicrobiota bacterium]
MNLLNESDLLLAGWLHGPQLTDMLAAVARMEERGITDPGYAMKLLRRDFPAPEPKCRMREEPAPLAAAIEATCQVDAENIGAVRRLMDQLLRVPVIQRGAVMPDACPAGHAVATIPVGGAIAVENAIIPGAHSEDVCCSLYATFFRTEANVETQLDTLMKSTRFGPGGRKEEDWVRHPVLDEDIWDNPFLQGLERHAAMHLADQGDGNHFAFLGEATFTLEQCAALAHAGHHELAKALAAGMDCGIKAETETEIEAETATQTETILPAGTDGSGGNPQADTGGPAVARWNVLVTHHGSRGLGAHVFKRGQKAAEKQTAKTAAGIPTAACWLDFDSEEGAAYWEALQYVGRWTKANHQCIHAGFAEKLGTVIAAAVGNEHNFVWKRDRIFLHGKGATPAWPDEHGRPRLGLIPLSMSSPILLVLGRNNEEYLSFAPHGAGRNVSRRAAVKAFRQEDGTIDSKLLQRLIAEQTPGISVRWWHGKPDLSETPMAYKPAAQVKAQIEKFGLADIVAEIRPLGCIMAGDAGPRPWERDKDLTPKQKRQIVHRADRRKSRQGLLNWEEDQEALP